MILRAPVLVGLALVACAACARPDAPRPAAAAPGTTPGQALAGYEAYFALLWNGARIGGAAESLRPRDDGLRFERRERVSMRRGDAVVHSELVIAITTDMHLGASDIAVWQITGDTVTQGRAWRDQHGRWHARHGDEPERVLPGDAVPAELVPLMLAADQRAPDARQLFRGPVILPGHGFAVATLEVEAVDERTRLATLHTRHGLLTSRMFLTRYGTLARVMGEHGTAAVRVAADDLAAPFEPPEIVDAASLAVTRAAAAGAHADTGSAADAPVLVIEPVHRAAPPALPGQKIAASGGSWRVQLGAGDTGTVPADAFGLASDASGGAADRELAELAATLVRRARAADARAEVAALVAATAELVDDDLGAPVASARAALALGRGDCTAHALLFAGLARARGIPVRLVTGYRLDGDRLVRHRWAMVAVGGAWVAVDPTYGEAPARPRLLGLAVHDASAADMAMADELAFAGLGDARAIAY